LGLFYVSCLIYSSSHANSPIKIVFPSVCTDRNQTATLTESTSHQIHLADVESIQKELEEVKKRLATVIAKDRAPVEPKVIFAPRERKLQKG
jgi:hypothetical protein